MVSAIGIRKLMTHSVPFKDTASRKGALLKTHFRNVDYPGNVEHKAAKCKESSLLCTVFKYSMARE